MDSLKKVLQKIKKIVDNPKHPEIKVSSVGDFFSFVATLTTTRNFSCPQQSASKSLIN